MPFKRVNKTLFHTFALAAAGASAFVFLGTLKNGFLGWDDNGYVLENPFIRTLALGPAFTRVVLSNWHPLTVLSYAVDFKLWGLDPVGYHLTNLVFHGLNAYLVALLTLKLLRAADADKTFSAGALVYASFFSALLFGVHPLRVESVAWVSERKDVLCGFFYLLSLIEYVKYARRKNGWAASYALSIFFFALALMSKPMAVTLPLTLLIIDYYPLRRLRPGAIKKLFLEKAPFAVLAAAGAAVTLWAQTKSIAPLKAIPFGARVAVAIRAYAFYLYKTALPVRLAPFYPLPQRPFGPVFFVSALALIMLAALTIALLRRSRAPLTGFLYYAVTLLPVAGLVQVGAQAAADRYTYLPLLGLTMVISAGAGRLFMRSRPAAIAVLAALTLALSILTVRQVPVWKDSLTLWSYEIEMYPGKVALSYVDRGVELAKLGNYDAALKDFDTAVRIAPDMMQAYNDRGVTLLRLGAYAGAVRDFDIAISYDPQKADTYQNRGIAYLHLNDYARSVSDLEKAVSMAPDNGVNWFHLGRAYAASGDGARAKESFRKARTLGVTEAEEELKRIGD